jgi:hypothetical protein
VTACEFIDELLVVGLRTGEVMIIRGYQILKSSPDGHKEEIVKFFKLPSGMLSLGKDGRAVLWNVEHLVPLGTFSLLGPTRKPLLISDADVGNEFLYVSTETGKIVRTALVNFLQGGDNQILKLTEIEGFIGVVGVLLTVNSEKTILAAAGGADLKLYKAESQKPFLTSSLEGYMQSLQWSSRRSDLLFSLTKTAIYVFNVSHSLTTPLIVIHPGGHLLAVDHQCNLLVGNSNETVKRIKLSERLK